MYHQFLMTLQIKSSAYYFKVGDRVIDKITTEYNPPSYWVRLKIFAKGRTHPNCTGSIINFWHKNFRRVQGFDPLVLFWINEPLQDGQPTENVLQQFYRPNISPGNYELAGLAHIKLPMRPLQPGEQLPANNTPEEQLPEFYLDESQNAPKHTSKRRAFPYGVYYVQVMVQDDQGNKSKKIFKVWGFRDPSKCKIRSSRFYERFMLRIKSILPPV